MNRKLTFTHSFSVKWIAITLPYLKPKIIRFLIITSLFEFIKFPPEVKFVISLSQKITLLGSCLHMSKLVVFRAALMPALIMLRLKTWTFGKTSDEAKPEQVWLIFIEGLLHEKVISDFKKPNFHWSCLLLPCYKVKLTIFKLQLILFKFNSQ